MAIMKAIRYLWDLALRLWYRPIGVVSIPPRVSMDVLSVSSCTCPQPQPYAYGIETTKGWYLTCGVCRAVWRPEPILVEVGV